MSEARFLIDPFKLFPRRSRVAACLGELPKPTNQGKGSRSTLSPILASADR
jgi:hypothetical protein